MSIKWIINEDELVFDEDSHTYWCNGVKCISVTQLIHYKFPKKYDGVSSYVLNKAALKGTEVHEAIEIYETYNIPSEHIEEFRNYLFLKKKFKFEVDRCEIPIIYKYKDLIICGRLDLVLKEKDVLGLGDIKRTSSLDKEYLTYQLNLYRLGFKQCYKKDIEFLRAIHLRESKRKYLNIPLNESIVYELLDSYRKDVKNESS